MSIGGIIDPNLFKYRKIVCCALSDEKADTVICCPDCREILHVSFAKFTISSQVNATVVKTGYKNEACYFFTVENAGQELLFHAPMKYFMK